MRPGQSRGWRTVEASRAAVPTVTPLLRCGCTELATECGARMTSPLDGLCDSCRKVTPAALEVSGLAYAHVGGVRPGTDVPGPHVTTDAAAMRST